MIATITRGGELDRVHYSRSPSICFCTLWPWWPWSLMVYARMQHDISDREPWRLALIYSQWRLWLTVYDGTQFGFDTQTTHRERPHATALMLAVMSVTLVTWRPRQTTVELACVRLRSNTCCLAPFHSILITWATVCYTGCYKHFAVHTTAVWQAKLIFIYNCRYR